MNALNAASAPLSIAVAAETEPLADACLRAFKAADMDCARATLCAREHLDMLFTAVDKALDVQLRAIAAHPTPHASAVEEAVDYCMARAVKGVQHMRRSYTRTVMKIIDAVQAPPVAAPEAEAQTKTKKRKRHTVVATRRLDAPEHLPTLPDDASAARAERAARRRA